jgi:methylmalonyl-CoA mutase
VRRAMAIQLIINKELGLPKWKSNSRCLSSKNWLIYEAAVLLNLTELRNVVVELAMETMYQRSKIQEESLLWNVETHRWIPIIGVNTFLSSKGSPTVIPAGDSCNGKKKNNTKSYVEEFA